MSDQVDMDAILDEALDDLDDEEEDGNDLPPQAANESLSTPSRLMDTKEEEQPPSDIPPNHKNDDQEITLELEEGDLGSDVGGDAQSPAAVFQNMLKEFIQAEEDDEGDPEERLGQFMNQVQSKLPGKDSKSLSSEKHSKTTGPENDVEKTMAAILEEMSKANINNGEPADIHEDEFLKEMFQNLQGGAGAGGDFNPESFNPDAVIDGMMEQLLSKDLMYEPMKQVTEKFPTWLQENKATLSPEDYEE
jgi:peroxin-19